MAHMVERGYSVRTPAWHASSGTNWQTLQDYPGRHEGMRIAGHDHKVEKVPIALLRLESTLIPLSGYKAICRTDNKQVLSVMKDSYNTIQNDVPWELIDELFLQGAKWDTAGILHGKFDEAMQVIKGQIYWCAAYLDEPLKVTGDDSLTFPYLFATWSHDGTQSLRFRNTKVRIVCANTQYAAMYGKDGLDLDVSIRHYGRPELRIAKAKEAIKRARESFKVYMDEANELARIPVTDKQMELFVETIVPVPDAAVVTDRVRRNVEKSRQQLRDIFNSPTISGGIRNTAYGLVQAGVEFTDHIRRCLNKDIYFTRNVIKASPAKMQLVQTARQVAMEMAI